MTQMGKIRNTIPALLRKGWNKGIPTKWSDEFESIKSWRKTQRSQYDCQRNPGRADPEDPEKPEDPENPDNPKDPSNQTIRMHRKPAGIKMKTETGTCIRKETALKMNGVKRTVNGIISTKMVSWKPAEREKTGYLQSEPMIKNGCFGGIFIFEYWIMIVGVLQ